MKRVLTEPSFHHVDTPSGLFTAAGFWYAIRKSTLVPLVLVGLTACSSIKCVEKPDDYRNALILVSDIAEDAIRFDAKVLGEDTQAWFL